MNKDKLEPQSQQGIIEFELFTCCGGDYCDVDEDGVSHNDQDREKVRAFLHRQKSITRKETLEEVVEVLKLAPIWGINTGLIDHIRAGESYASWDEVFKKLQSLINKKD